MTSVSKKTKIRLIIAYSLFLIICLFLVGRVAYIKLVYGKEYSEKAKLQRRNFDSIISPIRGTITDRNGNIFATSTKVYNIIFDSGVLSQQKEEVIEKTVNTLVQYIDVSKEELYDYLINYSDRHYIILQKEVSQKIVEDIKKEKNEGNIKGIWFEEGSMRSYPYDYLASHIIGYHKQGQSHWGIEEKYEEWLTGIPGRKLMVYENDFGVQQYTAPKNGNNIVLTIDQVIQHYLEQALRKAVEEQEPLKASAIVMNPNNGEILALANYPTVSPNDPMKITFPDMNEQLNELDSFEKIQQLHRVWRNYVISDSYEPGSTFKPMVMAAALEENIIHEHDTYVCNGYKKVADRIIRCWKSGGHGEQTIQQALANSCNIAVMEVAEKMGADIFYNYQKAFGFGEYTNIDLLGEFDAKVLIHKKENIGPVELATSSFGQTFNVTPLQLINAFSAVINGGELLKPYIVKKIEDDNGTIIQENKKQILRKVISKETSQLIKRYLRSVVTEGTGQSAQIEGYDIGGKTGTAEKGKRGDDKWVVSFIGYAPTDDPKIAVLVLLDEPKDSDAGSSLAVKTARDLLENILPYIDVYPFS